MVLLTLNGYCSSMSFMHVFNVFFYKSEKNMAFYVFYSQINVLNIYDSYSTSHT